MIRLHLIFLATAVGTAIGWSSANGQDDLPTVTNSLDMQLKLLPAGRFERGALSGAPMAKDHADFNTEDSTPRHQVILTRPFYISTTEVTKGQFARFVKATAYESTAESTGAGMVGWDPSPDPKHANHKQSFRQKSEFTWQQTGFPQDDDHPVVGVSFHDAKAFCSWLSNEEGKTYRLPTEAEWEYAARAGTQSFFSFGDKYRGVIEQHANIGNVELEKVAPDRVMRQWLVFPKTDSGDGHVYTSPVGSYKPNPFGLYDMHGNTWEWCEDKFLETYYKQFGPDGHHNLRIRAIDPLNTEDWNDTGDWRAIRGGSWFTSPMQARCGHRSFFESSDAAAYVGFRVVMDAPQAEIDKAKQAFDKSEAARTKIHDLAREFRERRKGIVTIAVRDNHLTNEFFGAIADLDEPIDIELDARGKLTGEHIEKLTRVKDLRGLKLSGTGSGITDDDLAPLARKSELELLQITGTVSLSDAMMDHLSGLKNLQSLSLHGDGITDEGLDKLPSLPHIKSIHIPGTQGTGAVLKKVTSGQLVDFQCKHFRDEDFQSLSRFAETLRTLRISGPMTDKGFQQIAKLRTLQTFSAEECPNLTDVGFQALGDLSYLRSIELIGTEAGDLTIKAIAGNTWLRELRIGSKSLTDTGVMWMSELVGVHDISVVSDVSPITDEAFQHFWRLKKLRSFRLSAPNITGTALAPLTECPKLDRVALSGKSINDAGLERLSQLRHLRHASVGSWNDDSITGITSEGLRGLANLPDGTRLSLIKIERDEEVAAYFDRAAKHLEVSGW